MSRAKNGTNPRFSNGKKVRSIYSPGWHGSRVPEGKPGNQRPLLTGDYLLDLHHAALDTRRVRRQAPVNPNTGEEWTD